MTTARHSRHVNNVAVRLQHLNNMLIYSNLNSLYIPTLLCFLYPDSHFLPASPF